MASLFKRKGVYYANLSHRGRRRKVSLKTTNYGVAKAKLRNMEQQVASHGLHYETRTPLKEAVPKFIAYLRARATGKGRQNDVYRLAAAFGPICEELQTNSRARATTKKAKARNKRKGRKRPGTYDCAMKLECIEDITTGAAMDFLVQLQRTRGIKSKTLNEYREILQRLCNWAIKIEGVRFPGEPRHNPVTDVPKFKAEQNAIRYLTIEQIHEQLAALSEEPQIQTMVAVYIYAGLRREELLWLTHEDLDLDRRVLHVREKTVEGRHWKPKTGVNRAVPISQALKDYIARWQAPAGQPWLFPSPQGVWWDPDNVSSHLDRLNKKAGLPWTCLDFRHSFGSQLAQRGVSLYKISRMMGNSPEICRRHYAHLTPESLEACVDFDEPQVSPDSATDRGAESGGPRLRLVV